MSWASYSKETNLQLWCCRRRKNPKNVRAAKWFSLILDWKIFCSFHTFNFFPPLPSTFVPKNKMSLVHSHIVWLPKEGKGGMSECWRQKHPKAIAFSISCTWLITSKLGTFHKRLDREREKTGVPGGHLWKISQTALNVYVSRYHISNHSQTGKNHPALTPLNTVSLKQFTVWAHVLYTNIEVLFQKQQRIFQ